VRSSPKGASCTSRRRRSEPGTTERVTMAVPLDILVVLAPLVLLGLLSAMSE
jgi:hypothetical protein